MATPKASRTTSAKKPPPAPLPTDMETPLLEYSESATFFSAESVEQQQRIAEAAYFRAERRGFEPGHELDDWLAAESEVVGHALQRSDARRA